MAERLRVREIDDEEGRRLVRVIRQDAGVGSDLAAGCRVDADGFGSLYPKYKRWPPAEVHHAAVPRDQKITKARPGDYDLPFSTWSLSKLVGFLAAEGVVDDISHEGPRILFCEEGVTFQRLKRRRRRRIRITWRRMHVSGTCTASPTVRSSRKAARR